MLPDRLKRKRISTALLGVWCLAILSACSPINSFNGAGIPPTGARAELFISDQTVQNGIITIDRAVSPAPGYVVIYADRNGRPGPVIGFTPVNAGRSANLILTIDVSRVTDLLYARLHLDSGEFGKFEYPGPDVPMTNEQMDTLVIFQVFIMDPVDSLIPLDTLEPFVVVIKDTAYY